MINILFKFGFILSFLALAVSQTFQQVKAEAEQRIKDLATQISLAYQNRCNSDYLACGFTSFNGCKGTSARSCFDDIKQPSGCSGGGAYLGDQSMITFPSHKTEENLDEQDIQFICTSGGIDQHLKDTALYPHKWAYYANYNGLMKTYPSLKVNCGEYDPRFRPWYVAATTGRKNVILMIDVSGSMSTDNPSRMSLAKDAAISVVDTLSPADTVTVIKFSSSADSLYFSTIVQATEINKNKIKQEIRNLYPQGATNYGAAFQKAFEMLQYAAENQFGAINCANTVNVLLFLTDGKPTEGQTYDQFNAYLQTKSTEYPFHLFTYSLGGDGTDQSVNRTMLKQLACNYDGITFEIQQSASAGQLVQIMREYYVFLSHGVTIEQPLWSEPYIDAWIEEWVITVVFPIYYEEVDSPGIRIILGVVGTDLTLDYLSQFGVTKQNALDRFVRSIPCQQNTLDECQLENLRSSVSEWAVCDSDNTCQQTGTIQSLCTESYPSRDALFSEPEDDSNRICCEFPEEEQEQTENKAPIGAIVGATIGSLAFIGVMIMVIKNKVAASNAAIASKSQIKYANNKPSMDEIKQNGNNAMEQNNYNPYENPYGNPYTSKNVNPYLIEQ